MDSEISGFDPIVGAVLVFLGLVTTMFCSYTIGAVLVFLGLVTTMFCSYTIVRAGQVGVKDFFGNIDRAPLQSGFNLKGPFTKIHKMSIQTIELKEDAQTPSKEGLTVGLEVSLLFRLDPSKAPEVYKTLGMDYPAIVVEPQLRSAIREITASYDAKVLYSSEVGRVQAEIESCFRKLSASKGIITEQLLLRKITLPGKISASIEAKLLSEQQSLQMQFVLTKETQEAERKRIEAQGIADFQKIAASGISPQLLEWKGIEATEQLASSPNAKIVVIGSGKNGLPLILGE